jgi:hypothetical protein
MYLTLVSASNPPQFGAVIPLGFLSLILLEPLSILGYNLLLTAVIGFVIGWLIHKLWQTSGCAALLISGIVFVVNTLSFFTYCMMNIRW